MRAGSAEAGDRLALIGYGVLAVLVALWALRGIADSATYDSGLAYVGGQVAWATGHPETWFSWTGTPFLAATMAVATRLMSAKTMGGLLTALNLVLVVGTVVVVLHRLRGSLAPAWWWIAAFAMLTFAPMMSSVWWKQFNIIALVLAVVGFDLLRRQRTHAGGAVIGLSLAIKPLAILLPFVLLAYRSTRRAGAWALVYLIGLNLGAQGLMAAHAHEASALNPLLGIQNFVDKSKPAAHLACTPENFAPQSLLCQLSGAQHIGTQRILVWLGLGLLAAWVFSALRGRDASSWDVFAFTCALSPMVSPIAWSHYQVMLVPLFLLLLVRFNEGGVNIGLWAGLAASFGLASLIWSPYGTLIDAIGLNLPATFRPNPHPVLPAVSQFAQYILVMTGVLWYVGVRSVRAAPGADVAGSD